MWRIPFLKEKNLTNEEKRRRFYERLKTQGQNTEEAYSIACYHLERDLGINITPEYPASKFVIQCEYWNKDKEQHNKEMRKMRVKSSKTFR